VLERYYDITHDGVIQLAMPMQVPEKVQRAAKAILAACTTPPVIGATVALTAIWLFSQLLP
jgi:hypothetical protein